MEVKGYFSRKYLIKSACNNGSPPVNEIECKSGVLSSDIFW
jgi:hypothetical protein